MPAKIERKINDVVGTNKILLETKKENKIYYFVECTLCGNTRYVRADNLFQKCKSCAAKIRNIEHSNIKDNLIGKKFGEWTVISKANKPNYWRCKCSCGVERDVFRGNLTQGMSKSCGCIKSWGEQQITYLLNLHEIPFEKEYTNDNLKTAKGGKYRFDFAVFQNNKIFCLIEFDGRQHYKFDKNWNMKPIDFLKLQEADFNKTEYCKNNNILLYRFNETTNLEEEIIKIKNLYNSTKGNN